MTLSGIEPVTFRFVAQHLNYCVTAVPPPHKSHLLTINSVRHWLLNPLTPKDHYSGRTAPLTSKRWILYIYSTNIGTEYFKHGIFSSFFSKCSLFHNSNVFGSCIIHILYTACAKFKKIIIPAPKG